MRALTMVAMFVSGSVLAAPPTKSAAGDTDAVMKSLAAYHEALGRGDGKDATRWVSQKTIAFYSDIRQVALNGSPEEVKRLTPMQKLTVLMLRAQLRADELADLDGKQLMAMSIERGWVSRDPLDTTALGKTTVKGDEAFIEHRYKGKATWAYRLVREKGEWHFDVTSAFPAAEVLLAAWAVEQDKKEDELLFDLVKKATGTRPTDDIWKAMR